MHILCAYTDQKLAQQGQKNSKSVLSALPTFRISVKSESISSINEMETYIVQVKIIDLNKYLIGKNGEDGSK